MVVAVNPRLTAAMRRGSRQREQTDRNVADPDDGAGCHAADNLHGRHGCADGGACPAGAAQLGGHTYASEAHLALDAGVAPRQASSGTHVRHRLNRTGNRQLNAILPRIAVSQRHHSAQASTYLAKKQAEGKTRTEAFRCLKRLLARVVYRAWCRCFVPTLAASPLPLT